jgi:hypothetical protein
VYLPFQAPSKKSCPERLPEKKEKRKNNRSLEQPFSIKGIKFIDYRQNPMHQNNVFRLNCRKI